MTSMSPAASRSIAIAILFLLFLSMWSYVVSPLTEYYVDKSAEVSLKRRQLVKYQSLLLIEESVDEQISLLSEAGSTSDLFLPGSKQAIASANMRELISNAVRASGAELISSHEYEAESIEGPSAVGLRVQLAGEVDNLVNLLYSIEGGRPAMFVEALTVNSSTSRVISARDRRLGRKQEEKKSLEISIDLVGYLVGGEGNGDADAT